MAVIQYIGARKRKVFTMTPWRFATVAMLVTGGVLLLLLGKDVAAKMGATTLFGLAGGMLVPSSKTKEE